MRRVGIAAAMVLSAAMAVQAADNSTQTVIDRHLAAIASGSVDRIMEDYADDVVMVDPGGVSTGKSAVRAGYARLIGSGMKPKTPAAKIYQGDLAFVVWAGADGKESQAESFIVSHGKISRQTVAVFGAPIPASVQ